MNIYIYIYIYVCMYVCIYIYIYIYIHIHIHIFIREASSVCERRSADTSRADLRDARHVGMSVVWVAYVFPVVCFS